MTPKAITAWSTSVLGTVGAGVLLWTTQVSPALEEFGKDPAVELQAQHREAHFIEEAVHQENYEVAEVGVVQVRGYESDGCVFIAVQRGSDLTSFFFTMPEELEDPSLEIPKPTLQASLGATSLVLASRISLGVGFDCPRGSNDPRRCATIDRRYHGRYQARNVGRDGDWLLQDY